MANTSARLEYLLERNASGEILAEERLDLMKIVFERRHDQEIMNWMSANKERFRFGHRPDAGTSERIFDSILNPHNQIPQEPAKVFEVPVRKNRIGLWTAAAVSIALLFGGYFYLRQPPITSPAKHYPEALQSSVNDISPGNNKATLTLANGSKIILDSAHNGFLAKQSGSSVIKTDSGQLSYLSSEALVKRGQPSANNTLTTPRGGQYQLTLPDGTKVWLNAASSITYPTAFVGKERKVFFTGEAYFEVVHNSKQPFVVEASDTRIEDIGTAFNVNAYPDENVQKTTLLEGSVKVIAMKQSFLLVPGEQARVGDGWFGHATKVNLTEVMAWKNGKIYLTDITLKEIMRNISRWYDVDIEYTGRIPDKAFNGIIERNVSLSVVLGALKAFGVETELKNKTVIVY